MSRGNSVGNRYALGCGGIASRVGYKSCAACVLRYDLAIWKAPLFKETEFETSQPSWDDLGIVINPGSGCPDRPPALPAPQTYATHESEVGSLRGRKPAMLGRHTAPRH